MLGYTVSTANFIVGAIGFFEAKGIRRVSLWVLVFDSIEQVGVLAFMVMSTLSNQVRNMKHETCKYSGNKFVVGRQ